MTPEECRALFRAQLDEALKAYHDLMLGASVRVVVDQNSERVEYTAANKQYLWMYIIRLQSAIASNDPCGVFAGINSRPARFLF